MAERYRSRKPMSARPNESGAVHIMMHLKVKVSASKCKGDRMPECTGNLSWISYQPANLVLRHCVKLEATACSVTEILWHGSTSGTTSTSSAS